MSAISGAARSAAALEIERETAVMKKTRDVETQTAASLIELVQQAPASGSKPSGPTGRIDYYA